MPGGGTDKPHSARLAGGHIAGCENKKILKKAQKTKLSPFPGHSGGDGGTGADSDGVTVKAFGQ